LTNILARFQRGGINGRMFDLFGILALHQHLTRPPSFVSHFICGVWLLSTPGSPCGTFRFDLIIDVSPVAAPASICMLERCIACQAYFVHKFSHAWKVVFSLMNGETCVSTCGAACERINRASDAPPTRMGAGGPGCV